MAPRRRAYAELRTDEYGNTPDARFLPHLARKSRDPPLRAIGLALLLLCFGTVLLTLGALSLDGRYHMPEKGSFRQMALAFTIVGSIAFIPGFYYTRAAYYAYRGYEGFSFDDIPQMD